MTDTPFIVEKTHVPCLILITAMGLVVPTSAFASKWLTLVSLKVIADIGFRLINSWIISKDFRR